MRTAAPAVLRRVRGLLRGPQRTFAAAAAVVMLAGAGTWTAVLVTLFAVGGSPYVVPHWIGWFREQPVARPALEPAPKPKRRPAPRSLEDLADLSDEALCLAWRASFPGLQRATSAVDHLRLVEERGAYLDELNRRHPDGVAAWLADIRRV